MTLCDTGPLFALVDSTQTQHIPVIKTLAKISTPLVTTWACFAEAMYLSLDRGGWRMQEQLCKLLLDNILTFYEIKNTEYHRLFVLLEKYRDRPMDLADATLVIAAEGLKENNILTLDSDFFFYLINDSDAFNVISLS